MADASRRAWPSGRVTGPGATRRAADRDRLRLGRRCALARVRRSHLRGQGPTRRQPAHRPHRFRRDGRGLRRRLAKGRRSTGRGILARPVVARAAQGRLDPGHRHRRWQDRRRSLPRASGIQSRAGQVRLPARGTQREPLEPRVTDPGGARRRSTRWPHPVGARRRRVRPRHRVHRARPHRRHADPPAPGDDLAWSTASRPRPGGNGQASPPPPSR